MTRSTPPVKGRALAPLKVLVCANPFTKFLAPKLFEKTELPDKPNLRVKRKNIFQYIYLKLPENITYFQRAVRPQARRHFALALREQGPLQLIATQMASLSTIGIIGSGSEKRNSRGQRVKLLLIAYESCSSR